VYFTASSYGDHEGRCLLYANRRGPENQRMAKHLLISGRVQGVGFRYSMAEEAGRLGATGWVRNRRDGTVEAVLDGPADAVDALLAWSRRGPPSARVTDVRVSESTETFEGFELRATE
jgi:acylphosphatase